MTGKEEEMSYETEREQFISAASHAGMPLMIAKSMLRSAAVLTRQAEAQCNGDYPYDGDSDAPLTAEDPERRTRWERRHTVCPDCKSSGVKKSSLRKGVCPECREEQIVHAKLLQYCPEFTADVCGNPRGYVLTLHANGREFSVPTRY